MRHGMYWSGDLAYRDADGWIYLAGRTSRLDARRRGEPRRRPDRANPAAAAGINHVAVYAVPDEQVGDQVMAAVVLNDGATLTPSELRTSSPRSRICRRRRGRGTCAINAALPQTATNKILKRTLIREGVSAGDGVLWERPRAE